MLRKKHVTHRHKEKALRIDFPLKVKVHKIRGYDPDGWKSGFVELILTAVAIGLLLVGAWKWMVFVVAVLICWLGFVGRLRGVHRK